ncbi:hypothetical protein CR513_06270, partial [Mucuna pruriens]
MTQEYEDSHAFNVIDLSPYDTERHARNRRDRLEPRRDNLESVKCKFPFFLGENNLDAYLDWDIKVEKLFECHDIKENSKVKLVTLEFSGYALAWWYQIMYDVRRIRKSPCDSWDELKKELIERFVSSYYARDLYVQLQREIQDIVELHHYSTLEDLVHQATKVESQLNRKLSSMKSYPSSSCKGKERDKEKPRRDKNPKKGSVTSQD